MSILVSTCYDINQQNTNNSKSKQLWSFNKGTRFDKEISLTNNIGPLDIKEQKSKYRGASMGYGDRPDFFAKSIKNKCDKFYPYKSDFDLTAKNPAHPQYSFGRKIYNYDNIYDKNIKFNYKKDHPGPGSYNIPGLNSNQKYSFGGRNYYNPKKQMKPGSGAYNVDEINHLGKYTLSKNPNIIRSSFGDSRSPRFRDIAKNKITPGPGAYNFKSHITGNLEKNMFKKIPQSYINSGFKNQYIEETPGPGQYRYPSEFGYYVDKNYITN